MKSIVLIGNGGHCRSCIDIMETSKEFKNKGSISHPNDSSKTFMNYKVLGNDNDINKSFTKNDGINLYRTNSFCEKKNKNI